MKLGIAVAVSILAVLPALAGSAVLIRGDYLEARSNHVLTCGCLFSGEMVTDGREAILAWKFDGGSYQGTSLEGVKVVAVLNGPGMLSLPGQARRAVLYIDGAGSESQRASVVSFLQQTYPAVIGEVLAVHSAPISFDKQPDRVSARVAGLVEVTARTARLPEDAHLGSFFSYEPFIPLADRTLAMTLLYEYRGGDFGVRWWRWEPGITGYFGRFQLQR